MKLVFLAALLFVSIITNRQQKPQNVFKITTFTKVPRNMEGCGENLFLNKQDEKAERFVFYTDYSRALICINNNMILITRSDKSHEKSSSVFSNKDYTLIVKYGQRKPAGDESYQIKNAIITLKYHSKVIWMKNVIGGGGC
nr:hypothetical protein [Mucilaginibacter sp. L294]